MVTFKKYNIMVDRGLYSLFLGMYMIQNKLFLPDSILIKNLDFDELLSLQAYIIHNDIR